MKYPAVIPAAGLGTRCLPASKAIPKEMLPVVDRPVVQYVVEEAVDAGCEDVLFVVGRNKNPLIDHFDSAVELEDRLAEKEQWARLEEIQRITNLAAFHFVRQPQLLGLGDAVLQARRFVKDSPFAVLLADDIIDQGDELLTRMMELHSKTGANVIAVQEIPLQDTGSYGVIAPAQGTSVLAEDEIWVSTMVEKPDPKVAPSNLAAIGRYVLDPEVFEVLERTSPGTGGEVQLTDALRTMAQEPRCGGLIAVVHNGKRYDTGNKLEYVKASIEFALGREDMGAQLRQWLAAHPALNDTHAKERYKRNGNNPHEWVDLLGSPLK